MADNQYGKKLISWSFPEFAEAERGRAWYITAIVIGLILLVYSIFISTPPNFLFAMIIVVAAVVIFLKHSEETRNVKFTIYQDGIMVGSTLYDFKDFRDFYLIYEPPEVKNLYLNFTSLVRPRLQITLEDINPIKVREILLDYINEDLEHENEPLSDALGRILKL